ncbi:MAG: hypothetical protein KDA96_04530 [Planctomycetaceae bacterium]|nr:hypothetical protein [Planctomycetaceae bacterium]
MHRGDHRIRTIAELPTWAIPTGRLGISGTTGTSEVNLAPTPENRCGMEIDARQRENAGTDQTVAGQSLLKLH